MLVLTFDTFGILQVHELQEMRGSCEDKMGLCTDEGGAIAYKYTRLVLRARIETV